MSRFKIIIKNNGHPECEIRAFTSNMCFISLVRTVISGLIFKKLKIGEKVVKLNDYQVNEMLN